MNNNGSHRDERGRFRPGCPGGPGRPEAGSVQLLRDELFRTVSPERFKRVLSALLEKAESGDVQAARVVLDRTLGAPLPADVLERIDALEQQIQDGELAR